MVFPGVSYCENEVFHTICKLWELLDVFSTSEDYLGYKFTSTYD
jgi:hypothetical protein